jgi:hypothetical protein
MANIITVSELMDGPSHVTIHCFMKSDPTDGEVTNYVLIDPVDLSPPLAKKQNLILKQVWYEVGGFAVTFSFGREDGNNLPIWTLTPGASLHHDWRFFGGLRDRVGDPSGLTANGKLLMSTNGFLDNSDSGSFVLWLEKRQENSR